MSNNTTGSGTPAAATAYFLWGLFPLYWTLLSPLPLFQVLAQRALWCAVCVWLYLLVKGQGLWWRGLSPRVFWMLVTSALLMSINWGVFILAINTGHVLDTSLGYFITPLVSVLFGVVLLRERPGAWQWFALACAAFGVCFLAASLGAPPWVALILAMSFGAYGLIRKLAAVDAVHGLALESAVMLIPASIYLMWCELAGRGVFLHEALRYDLMLVAGGVITAVPLALFAYGARRVPMTVMGFLQYIGPTVTLLSGVFLFREPFGVVQAVAFGFIWLGLAIFALDGLRRLLSRPAVTALPPE